VILTLSQLQQFFFKIDREPGEEWPDIRWPDWKPGSAKKMHPDAVCFYFEVRDGVAVTAEKFKTPVNVYGPRLTATGRLGAVVDNKYYYLKDCPEFVQEILKIGASQVNAILVRHEH
jgi:hypothetical protein